MATYEATRYSTTGANIPSNTIPATSVVDGTVSNTEFAYINSLSSNAQTQITASVPKAGATMTGSLVFPDSTGPAPAFIAMGAGTDIKVSSDGSTGLVIGNALEMQTTTAEKYLTATADGAVDVYHNNVKKLETSATGVTVTGTAATTAVTGDGSGLTALNATNLGSGTVPDARFPATLPAISGANLTSLPVPSLSLNIQVLTSGNYTPTTGLKWATVYACSGGSSGEAYALFGGTNPYGYRLGGGGGYAGNFVYYTYTGAEIGTGTSTVTYGAGGATSTAPASPTSGGTTQNALRNFGGNTLFDPQGTGTTLISLGAKAAGGTHWSDSQYTSAGHVPMAGASVGLAYNPAPSGSQGSDWNAAQASAIGNRPFMSNRLSGSAGAATSIGSGSTTTSANGGAASMPGAGGGGGVARALPYFSASGQGGAGGAGFVVVYEYILT